MGHTTIEHTKISSDY